MAEKNGKQNAEQDISQVSKLRRDKLASMKSEGHNPFEITKFERTSNAATILSSFETLEGKEEIVAGRIISKRVMGKASFFHIMDGTGKLQ